jgi:hypothetical protein
MLDACMLILLQNVGEKTVIAVLIQEDATVYMELKNVNLCIFLCLLKAK